jgi:hypothetical protein
MKNATGNRPGINSRVHAEKAAKEGANEAAKSGRRIRSVISWAFVGDRGKPSSHVGEIHA